MANSEKLYDVARYDGIMSVNVPPSAVDDGEDRQGETWERDASGRLIFDMKRYKARRERNLKLLKERADLAFNGILANEVQFIEFFDRDQYDKNKPVRVFYCQVPMFLDWRAVGYCGRATGKTWGIKWRSVQRAVKFPGSQIMVWSHDDAHVKPRANDVFRLVDTHPFFSQLIPGRNQSGRSRKAPYEQQWLNGHVTNWVYPGNEGKQLEKFHVDGSLCLAGESLVTLENGDRKSIREIVDKRIPAKVLSYNTRSGQVEAKRIVGWYANPRGARRMVAIGGLLVTEDHPIFTTNRGYIRADNLDGEDFVLNLGERNETRSVRVNRSREIHCTGFSVGRRVSFEEQPEFPPSIYAGRGSVRIPRMEVNGASPVMFGYRNNRTFSYGIWRKDLSILHSELSGFDRGAPPVFMEGKTVESRFAGRIGRSGSGGLVHGRWERAEELRRSIDLRFSRGRCRSGSGLFSVAGPPLQTSGGQKRSCVALRQRGNRKSDATVAASLGSLLDLQEYRNSKRRCFDLREPSETVHYLRGIFSSIQNTKYLQRCLSKGARAADNSSLQYESAIGTGDTAANLQGMRKTFCGVAPGLRKKEPSDDLQPILSVSVNVEESEELPETVYCIDVEDNHNFFVEGFLVHNCDEAQEIQDIHMAKWEPTQNDYRVERGAIRAFFGVNTQGRTNTPFYQMTFQDSATVGHIHTIPSWHNPREYTVEKHAENLKRYGGNINTPQFKQMVRGTLAEKAQGVFPQVFYLQCTKLRRDLERRLAQVLPYRVHRLDLNSFNRRTVQQLVTAPLVVPKYKDIRIGMDFGFGGGLTVIELYFLLDQDFYPYDIWHLAEHFSLSRVPEPKQAELLHHLMNREGNGLYEEVSYCGIDVTGNRNIYAYLTDPNDIRFNNPVNDYNNRLIPVNFERPVVTAKVSEEPPDDIRNKKTRLPDGGVAWNIYEDVVPFSTGLIANRQAQCGYSLPDEDEERLSEFINLIQQGKKYIAPKNKDHTVAANRCFELTIHEKDTLEELERQLMGTLGNYKQQSGGYVINMNFDNPLEFLFS
jgi:hypothetical protein